MEPKKRGRPAKAETSVETPVEIYPSVELNAFGRPRVKEEPPAPTPAPDSFFVELHIGDKVFKSSGTDPSEALSKLPKPEKLMQKGSITLSNGDRTNTVLMYPKRIKMLFMSKGYQSLQMKTLTMGMK